jgi:hypothetical protein
MSIVANFRFPDGIDPEWPSCDVPALPRVGDFFQHPRPDKGRYVVKAVIFEAPVFPEADGACATILVELEATDKISRT